jgi:hypothetical protein
MAHGTVGGPAAATPRGHRGQGRRIVAALAVTTTVGYGCLYYSYAVLLGPMAADLGAPVPAVTGALTASVLAGALAAIPVGRWLDRHGGRALMTAGSAAATVLLVAWSQVRTVGQLYAVMVGVGVAGATVLYEPAFAVLVSWFDPRRRARALLAVTVVAGFASTVFMPLTGLLVAHLGWRAALLVLAAVVAGVTVPLHAAVVRRPPPAGPAGGAEPGRVADPRPAPGPRSAPGSDPGSDPRRSAARAAARDPAYRILAAALVAQAAATSTVAVHLVGYLTSRGHPVTFAASCAGLLGVLSVTGRLVLTGARRRVPVTTVAAVIFAVQAAAALAMPLAAGTRAGAVATVVGFGLGFGVASLATPTLLADRYGVTAYATIAGRLAAPVTVARALAPLSAAVVIAHRGYPVLPAAVGGAGLIASAGRLALGRRRLRPGPRRPGSSAVDRPGRAAQNSVSGPVGSGSGRGSSPGTRERTSSWNRRARSGASTLSGVCTKNVGERPSCSQPVTTSSHGCQPSTVRAGSSRPRYRTIGAPVRASARRGSRGLRSHASRSASVRGGLPKNAVVSNGTHSAPAVARTARSAAAPAGSVKKAGWRTSTAYRCPAGSTRRNRARSGTSAGPKEAGSCTHRACSRGPSGSSASRNARRSACPPASRCPCVTALGSLGRKRNPGPVWRAHDSTVSRAGVA